MPTTNPAVHTARHTPIPSFQCLVIFNNPPHSAAYDVRLSQSLPDSRADGFLFECLCGFLPSLRNPIAITEIRSLHGFPGISTAVLHCSIPHELKLRRICAC